MMMDLKGLNQQEMEDYAKTIGESAFRGRQLFKWIYNKGESDFGPMTDIGKALKEKLSHICYVSQIKPVNRVKSANGDTEKFLFELSDGNHVESVLMRYEEHLGFGRTTACISTQVGCAQGCAFCASGKHGFIRNLTAAEIVDQVIQIQNTIDETEERVSNVVIMGIGEPLVNYDNVLKAIHLINHCDGVAIGIRHIAVSTVGIPALIRRLADEKLHIRFAVSLHAPNDEIRNKIMPVNHKFPISELIDACKYYQKTTERRITIEYMLIDGLNDSPAHARELAKLLDGLFVMVNLIPLNPVEHFPYKRPPMARCRAFIAETEKYGLKSLLRNERGTGIDAACGQLRNRVEESASDLL
ncbi:MAG: 23S rRNA (adenine(2503)-C(2))-methyltransferase RlmN [Firmicutes bacterium]|nr:23S rRNA (adenine(2503)-C(2))-methyltransferase RlmN [Bacillota bacterium]